MIGKIENSLREARIPSTLTVKVEVEKKALPALDVRNIGYVQIVSGLASEDTQISSAISI